MATARIEDLYGGLDITVFPKAYGAIKDSFVEDAVVVAEGRLSLREEKPKMMIEKITTWESENQQPQVVNVAAKDDYANGNGNGKANGNGNGKLSDAECKLYVKLQDESDFDALCSILQNYVGNVPVVIVVDGHKKRAPYCVRRVNGLVYELEGLLGDNTAVFVDKKPG